MNRSLSKIIAASDTIQSFRRDSKHQCVVLAFPVQFDGRISRQRLIELEVDPLFFTLCH